MLLGPTVCSFIMSVNTPGTLTTWFGCPVIGMFCPAMVRLVISLDPETPVHEALDSAIATYAVIWFGLPGNKTRFPIADWLSACEDPIATESNPSAVANGVCIAVGAASISFCPEDANEPVSIIVVGPSSELIDKAVALPSTDVV